MLLPLLLSLLGLTQAQHHCCAPIQWEAYLGQIEGYYKPNTHAAGLIQGVDIVSYDALNQRMVITTNLYADGVHLPITTVHNDYANHVQWKFNSTSCSKVAITGKMPSNCIPANANYTGAIYFGVGRDKLMMDAWTYALSNVRFSITMTQNGCYPVTEGIVGTFGADAGTISQCKTGDCTDAIIAYGITGLTVGIKSQSIFDLPGHCQAPSSHDPIDGYTVAHHLHEIRKRQA
ncbi:uncharacterized protein LOC135462211 [Liolophura sinensis]|uniref:uncharacterized protein LOC135462211 n=1 Tax=Liolophura sinensis TaxID=3198878 RepID=UPI00315843FF